MLAKQEDLLSIYKRLSQVLEYSTPQLPENPTQAEFERILPSIIKRILGDDATGYAENQIDQIIFDRTPVAGSFISGHFLDAGPEGDHLVFKWAIGRSGDRLFKDFAPVTNNKPEFNLSFATKPKKRKRCNPAKSWKCGDSCQSFNKKNCPSDLPQQAKTLGEWVEKRLKRGAVVPDIEETRALSLTPQKLIDSGRALFPEQLEQQLAREVKISKAREFLRKKLAAQEEIDQKDYEDYKKLSAHRIPQSVVEGMESFRQNLIASSAISKEAADAISGSISFTTGLNEAEQRDIKEFASDFYRLTQGKANSIMSISHISERAHARSLTYSIDTGDSIKSIRAKPTMFHEMGHFIEFEDQRIGLASKEWVQSRATGEPEKLSKITGSSLYRDDEVAVPGDFIDPYAGKIYKNETSEVISIGMEAMTDASAMADFYSRDPEHFFFVLGAMRN